jgi:hypothetical protein
LLLHFSDLPDLKTKKHKKAVRKKKPVMRKVNKVQRWTDSENKEVKKYFKNFLRTQECPGKEDCLEAMSLSKKNGGTIHARPWETLKKKVHNTIQSQQNKPSKTC